MCIINFLRSLICKRKKRIVLLIDGPNMIRREFNINLYKIMKKVSKYGTIKKAIVFLNQYANDKLIEAVTNQGYVPVVLPTDVDVAMAVEAVENIHKKDVDVIALVTRDADFQPVLEKAREYGKETIIVADEPFASALKNMADHVIKIGEDI